MKVFIKHNKTTNKNINMYIMFYKNNININM